MTNRVLGSRRTTMEILYEILSMCSDGGTNKTTIMYGSNLSHDQLQRYLSLLSTKNLVDVDDSGRFQVTSSGREMLGRLSTVTRMLRDLRQEMEAS